MRYFQWNRNRILQATAIAAVLLVAYPTQAQNQSPTTPPTDKAPDSVQVRTRAALQTLVARDPEMAAVSLVSQFVDPADEMLGATLQPVSNALRAQLDIPAGQGLLVTALREDGPSAQAGLKQNDILLSLGDKPLTAAADVTRSSNERKVAPAEPSCVNERLNLR